MIVDEKRVCEPKKIDSSILLFRFRFSINWSQTDKKFLLVKKIRINLREKNRFDIEM